MPTTVLPDPLDDPAALEAGRRLFAQPCAFVAGVADLARLPPAGLPEVAFAGRSNVGKSSLINALTGRGQLARISRTPGRTQQINLFDLGGRLTLVDLPGYGYAQAPKPTVEAWQRLMRAYLRGRASLRRTCVLVDARHGLKDNDRAFMALLAETAVAFQLVLTKADLVRPAELDDLIGLLGADLERQPGAHPGLIVTSAQTTEVLGDGHKVNGLVYRDRAGGDTHRVELEGIFVQIGLLPNTEWLKGVVTLSPRGEIVVDDRGQTNVPGVFAAGDATTVPYKQIVIAMGEGSKAALGAFDHLIRTSAPVETPDAVAA